MEFKIESANGNNPLLYYNALIGSGLKGRFETTPGIFGETNYYVELGYATEFLTASRAVCHTIGIWSYKEGAEPIITIMDD